MVDVQKGALGFTGKKNLEIDVRVPSNSHLHSLWLHDNSPQ